MTTKLLIGLGLVAVGLAVGWCARPRDNGAGYQQARQLQQQNAQLRDTIRLANREIAGRDSQIAQLHDSAQHSLDSADVLGDSVQKLLRLARRVDTVWQAGVPIVTETIDSSALAKTCELRYELRTSEGLQLRLALGNCQHENTLYQTNEGTLKRTLVSTATALFRTDSTLTWVLANPPPCTQDLLVAKVACWKVETGVAVVSFLGGVLVAKK